MNKDKTKMGLRYLFVFAGAADSYVDTSKYKLIKETAVGKLAVVAERIDIKNSPQFKTEILNYVQRYNGKGISVDFSGVSKIDTSGFIAIGAARALAKQKNLELKVENLKKEDFAREALEV